MSSILKIDETNIEGYLKLVNLKIQAIERVERNEKFNRVQFLKDEYIDYGAKNLKLLFKNVGLSCQELDVMGLSYPILNEILQELTILNFELVALQNQYPYLDADIPLDVIIESLKTANVIDDEEYNQYMSYISNDNQVDNKKI